MTPLNQMEAYLASVPGGIEGYPDAQHKASTLRLLLETLRLKEQAGQLPPVLADIVRNPPPVSNWISEVHATAIYLAGRDLRFPSDDAFLRVIHQSNRALLDGPLYWAMFRLVGADRVMQGAAGRWGQFHKGSTLTTRKEGKGAVVTLTFPPNLFPSLMVRCYATAVCAAVEVAGGKNVKCDIRAATHVAMELAASWG